METPPKTWSKQWLTEHLASCDGYPLTSQKSASLLQFLFVPIGIFLSVPTMFTFLGEDFKATALRGSIYYVCVAPLFLLFIAAVRHCANSQNAEKMERNLRQANQDCLNRVETQTFILNLIGRIIRSRMETLEDFMNDLSPCPYDLIFEKMHPYNLFKDVVKAVYDLFEKTYGITEGLDVVLYCMKDENHVDRTNFYYPKNAKPRTPLAAFNVPECPIIAAAKMEQLVIIPDVDKELIIPGYPHSVKYIRTGRDAFQGAVICSPVKVQNENNVSMVLVIRIDSRYAKVDAQTERFIQDALSRFHIHLEHGRMFYKALEIVI